MWKIHVTKHTVFGTARVTEEAWSGKGGLEPAWLGLDGALVGRWREDQPAAGCAGEGSPRWEGKAPYPRCRCCEDRRNSWMDV